MKRDAPAAGLTILASQVEMNESIRPALQELTKKGAQAFIIPLDVYYGVRDKDEFARQNRMPGVSFVNMKSPGAVLYVGSDYDINRTLSALQAAKILVDGVRPETLPILRQQELTIMADIERIKDLGIEIAVEVFQIAKPIQ